MGRKGRVDGALLGGRDGARRVRKALRERGLDGWLLYDFKDRNPIAQSLLGLEWTTRRGFALIPAQGDPKLLISAIESSSWAHLPWERTLYSTRGGMEAGIRELISGLGPLAAEVSDRSDVPYLDLLPGGIQQLIGELGGDLRSSGDLVSAFYATWSRKSRANHARASAIVKDLARDAFDRVASRTREGGETREGELAEWIRSQLADRGAPHQADCIVAIGPNAADPHYDPGNTGARIRPGDLLLIDLWGATRDGSAPADQTWMGYLGARLPPRLRTLWRTIRKSRDAAATFLSDRWAKGAPIRGFEVDDVARGVIEEAGYGRYFIHRTGHSIDRDIHGRGPNLDNMESRDTRELLPGVGFSIEPGIYIPDEVGLRTEINVFMGPRGPEVTVDEPQREVFLLLP